MIGFVTWPLFLYQHYYKGGQVTKPIILVKYAINYFISFKEFKIFLIKYNNFLASANIKVLVTPTYLFAMLLLIGLATLYTPGVFLALNLLELPPFKPQAS